MEPRLRPNFDHLPVVRKRRKAHQKMRLDRGYLMVVSEREKHHPRVQKERRTRDSNWVLLVLDESCLELDACGLPLNLQCLACAFG